ncbi:MAG: XdhC family protein [Thermoanaerobaculia bacterium]
MRELERIVEAIRESAAAGAPSAVATILGSKGSSFRRPGARLWLGQGRCVGAISGGCLEADLAERVPDVLAAGVARVVTYDTGSENDVLWGTASGCGGALDILLEPAGAELVRDLEWVLDRLATREAAMLITTWDAGRLERARCDDTVALSAPQSEVAAAAVACGRSAVARDEGERLVLAELHQPPVALSIFGSGADAEAMAALAKTLGWDVRTLRAAETDAIPRDSRSAVLVMTHNFHRDVELAGALRGASIGYVGILGPRRRTEDLLAQAAVAASELPALHVPPGLDLGGETPEEIALSVVAEIQAVMAGRTGGSLQAKRAPIHDAVERVEIGVATGGVARS